MIGGWLHSLGRAALMQLDPETAHALTIRALAANIVPTCPLSGDPRLATRAFGLDFPNPLGMAAGFDKNGEVPDALLAQGLGFVEVGTVTPRPQRGNPKPRIFRLAEDRAVINRLGFNNEGHAALRRRLDARVGRQGIVGVNIGANKDSDDRVADYVAGIEAFADVAAYFTINISSPNTPGLRDLQERGALRELMKRCLEARDGRQPEIGRRVPVLVKIAPDLDEAGLAGICEEALAAGVDGLIVSNTTLARDGLRARSMAGEAGGLSGCPLYTRATRILAKTRLLVGPDLPLIGVGGIDSGEAAWRKIEAGANLVQLYTGFVFEGPMLIREILRYISTELAREGLEGINSVVGRRCEEWAHD